MICKSKQFHQYRIITVMEPEANLEQAAAFKQFILQELAQGHTKLVINFTHVVYVDSSFLAALVASMKQCLAVEADLLLIELKEDVEDLFKLIRLDKVFTIYANAESLP